MHLPDISSGTLIQGLRFLYDLYKDRRDRKKNEGNDPDPEKLEELIKELQLKAQHGEPSSRLRKNSVQSGGDKGFTPVTLLLYRFGGFWYALARASAPPEVDVTRHRSDKWVWNSTQPT
jgi:hypothetical protein